MQRKFWHLDEVQQLYQKPFMDLIFQAQSIHRENFNPNEIEVNALLSIKTGACPEDCAYCPQSSRYKTGVKREAMLDKEKIIKVVAKESKKRGITRYGNKKLHDHLIIYFKNQKLFFNDPRKFGAVLVFEEENPPKSLKILGIEPLEENFNGLFLKNALKNKGSKIKSLIMEQSLVVGVGNIYAAEALFLAKISPFRAGKSLSDKDCENLASAIKQVLKKGIENQGTTLKDYKQSDGSSGHNQDSLLVYGRDNQPCYNCKTLIKNQVISGRATYFCPNCQK